ncbi:MAG: sulfatase-like hydrolase/transferase [bacterium]|nr:sulfatase-like hydrolase/transferase [bacterium]
MGVLRMRGGALLALATAGFGLALCACGVRRPAGEPPRHLVVVTVAGWRADHTTILGYGRDTTWFESTDPDRTGDRGLAFDDLAAQGVVFANAFAAAGRTDVALASMHVGRPPEARGADLAAIHDDEQPLAEILGAADFLVAGFVARPRGHLGAGWGRGFAHLEQTASDAEAVAAAASWVEGQDFTRSTCVWLHLEGPSFPFEPHSALRDGQPIDFARAFVDPEYTGDVDGSEASRASGEELASADRRHVIGLYDAELAESQARCATFLAHLRGHAETRGAWEDIAVIVTGSSGLLLFEEGDARRGATDRLDQGAPLPEPSRVALRRVPLLLRHPRSLTGRRIFEARADHADLVPTVAEWLGIAREEQASARSWLRIVR